MEKIAEEIFNIIREQIISRYPFLANAAYAVDGKSSYSDVDSIHSVDVNNDMPLYTDGNFIFYNANTLIQMYQEDETILVHALLHTLLHLLFLHPWRYDGEQNHVLDDDKQAREIDDDNSLWDLACDIAVESVIAELSADSYSEKELAYFSDIKKNTPFVSAKTIYQYLKGPVSETVNVDLSNPLIASFKKDTHIYWYRNEKDDIKQNENNSLKKQTQENDIHHTSSNTGKQSSVVRKWLAISRKTLNEWKNLYHAKGSGSGSFMENMMYTNKKTYDYRQFLKQFSANREIIRINDEEFDYIYYTYGLELYNNLPFIEPLEYKMENRIQDFVIALDTSGSCSGDLLQEFVNKTFDILKNEETFHRQMNIHLLQCDSDITNIKIINNHQDIKAAIENFNVYGYGGTDFRPVFRYVDAMIENGKFTDLKGLIYFTDGEGIFPEKIPDYKTAFVFVEDGFTEPKVPAWAIRIVLSKTEIMKI